MASSSDLEKFRQEWEKELSRTRRRNQNVAEQSQCSRPSVPPASDRNELATSNNEPASNNEPESSLAIAAESLGFYAIENNDSNSTENYHPFVIVDNLLKGGGRPTCNSNPVSKKKFGDRNEGRDVQTCQKKEYFHSTRSDGVSTRPTPRSPDDSGMSVAKKARLNKPSMPYNNSQNVIASRMVELETKEQKRLLDQLISDLDEISEIPFFDINLPRELAIKIFQHLGLTDLCRCAQVSRAWKNLAEDELLWFRICVELGERKTVTEGVKWKNHAQTCVTRSRNLMSNWKSRVGSLQQLQYIKGGILCHVSSCQKRVVAGYSNGQVKMWDLASGEECVFQPSCTALTIDEGQEEGTLPNLLVCTSTGEQFTAAGYSQGIVDIWQTEGSTCPVYTFTSPYPVSHTSLAPDQPLLITSYGPFVRTDFAEKDSDFQQLQVLDLNSQVKHVQLVKYPEPYEAVWYKSVICTSNIAWVHRPGQPESSMTEIHNMIDAPITAMDLNPLTNQLALGVSVYGGPLHGCKLKVYALDSGRLESTLKGHTFYISCINLRRSPVHYLVTGCGDRKVRVFDLRCPLPVLTLAGHSQPVSQVQLDDWKVVSGGEEGLTCVWDQRMALKLWDWHNRHPVRYSQFEDSQLIVANVPLDKFPQMEEFESVLHKRYRGSIQVYDFLSDQTTQGVPENCLSNYDMVEGYDYNIRLTVPYDAV